MGNYLSYNVFHELKPKIEADVRFKAHIFNSLKSRYEKERVGIHSTDLLWPRQSVFRKLQGTKISERDVVFFTLGAGEGAAAEELVGGRSEVIVIHNQIIHTIDSLIFEGGRNFPVEIKTARSSPPSIRKHYLLQLGTYCLALHVDRGKLLIFYLNDGVLEAYNVRYPPILLKKIDGFEVEKRDEILRGWKLRDPMKTSYIAGDPDLDWKCLTCQYWPKCRGEHKKFKVAFPQPLMVGRAYESMVLREAFKASEWGCDVKIIRKLDEITGVEASGDVVKLVPLRRAVEEIQSRLS